ncbi:MAG: STAS domain-containing protein [Phycisphaerales bacterium]|jgi:anti-anti-sigma factor|nr:STAS domain-containing protein [Phycisphaerales bacterium]
MKMHFEEHRSAIVLRLEGECTHEDVDGFRRRCQEWLARGGGSYIIDGEAMGRIDSAGLEALLWFAEEIRRASGRLRLARLSELVSKAMIVTRLDRRFEIHDSIEEAARSLSRSEAA